jgi:small-conductance mechanosensitive channel
MELLQKIKPLLEIYCPKIIIGLLIIFCAWFIAVIVSLAIKKFSCKLNQSKRQITALLATTSKTIIIIIGVITGLGTIGIDISALIASLGLTGFALGFALKDAVSNLLSGILLLLYQPFTYGDLINVAGCEGTVAEINLRYTVIQNEKDIILIPNSSLFNNTVRLPRKTTEENTNP